VAASASGESTPKVAADTAMASSKLLLDAVRRNIDGISEGVGYLWR
jgi:hypothetical protein